MPDTTHDATHRTHNTENRAFYRASGDDIQLRDDLEGDDGMFEIRMPIASTGIVRNEGDDPLTRDELEGMAQQVADTDTGVFPEHGNSGKIDPARYAQIERLGNWTSGEIESRGDDDLLMATARLADPETLPSATGDWRETLAILKEQAKRGIGINSSIGWREDDSFPGGNDLMEASIVGIGADWRTNTTDEGAEVVARAAVEAGVDPEELLGVVERAVNQDMSDDTDSESDTADSDTEQSEEPDESRDAPEWAERMLELQEAQTETLNELADSLREDDDDEEEEDDESEENDSDEDDNEEDDEDEEQSTQDADDADLRERIAEMEAALSEVRSGEGSVASPDGGTKDGDEDVEREADTDSAPGNWRDEL